MKKIIAISLSLIILLSLAITVTASTDINRILDGAQILSKSEQNQLQQTADKIAEQYEIEILIVTVKSTYHMTAEEYAENFYFDGGYGYGEDQSGIMLLITFDGYNGREWTVRTVGEGRDILSDSASEDLMEDVASLLSDKLYFDAFSLYLKEIGSQIQDYYTTSLGEIAIYVLIAVGIGLLVGFITIMIMKSAMKTAVFQHGAAEYVVNGTYNVHTNRDIFLYSHISKVRRSSDSSGSGGGSSRSGRSGGSSGRF